LKSFLLKTKRRSGGRTLSCRRPMGVRERSPGAAAIFQVFLKKIRSFDIVWSKFRVFKWLNKVLMRSQAFALGHVFPLAPLLLRHWTQKQRQ